MKSILSVEGKVRVWVREGDSATCQDILIDSDRATSEELRAALQHLLAKPHITDDRAAEIRAELCEKHGAQWLHHYHRAIEAEVLK